MASVFNPILKSCLEFLRKPPSRSPMPRRTDLYHLSFDDLVEFVTGLGFPAFRAKQIWRQLYVKQIDDPAAMTDLPQAMRNLLCERAECGSLELAKVFCGDGGLTRKALFRLPTGEAIETVLMVYPERATVCVSSQAGCPMGCTFCATARLGFLHDLTAGQIVQQVLWAARELRAAKSDHNPVAARKHRFAGQFPERLSNVVFMGMGEPFNNYDNCWASIERLHDPTGFNLGARNFTVSTAGLIPGIQRLAEEALPVNLAVSLHAADDERRSSMMPVNRRYPIDALLQAVRAYISKTGRRVSFEYVLIQGENDTRGEARHLARRLTTGGRFPCHVNLIPFNPVRDSGFERSGRQAVEAFRDILEAAGISATVRIQRGADIDAACGQLAGGVSS